MHKNAGNPPAGHPSSLPRSATAQAAGVGATLGFAPVSVAVLGARGYSGLELVRLLAQHPGVERIVCVAHDSSFALENYLSEFSGPLSKRIDVVAQANWDMADSQILFLATPAEVSAEWGARALALGLRVIDLSGAHRLKQDFKKWYGFEHPAPGAVEQAVYGLSPWISVQDAQLVANPGCYATSILMAVLPLLDPKRALIDPETLVIDAKSGTSGAGRKASENLLFTEVADDCLPYRVGKHQHTPEIEQAIAQITGLAKPRFAMATHLLPVRRGIVSSIYARLTDSSATREAQLDAIGQAFSSAYRHYPLVKFGPIGGKPIENPMHAIHSGLGLSLKRVVGTARVHVQYDVVDGRLYLFSLIDNLLKGAASQAIENFNQMTGRPAAFGLESLQGVL